MLILTRRISEAIRIGTEGEVTVKILSIRGNHVKLGIDAPPPIPVHRQEIFERKQLENKVESGQQPLATDVDGNVEAAPKTPASEENAAA